MRQQWIDAQLTAHERLRQHGRGKIRCGCLHLRVPGRLGCNPSEKNRLFGSDTNPIRAQMRSKADRSVRKRAARISSRR